MKKLFYSVISWLWLSGYDKTCLVSRWVKDNFSSFLSEEDQQVLSDQLGQNLHYKNGVEKNVYEAYLSLMYCNSANAHKKKIASRAKALLSKAEEEKFRSLSAWMEYVIAKEFAGQFSS